MAEKMLFKNKFNKPRTAIFKITSSCNQKCKFCSELPFLQSGRSYLEHDEIVANYRYLSKNFNIYSVVLSGGEPTLHPDYFSILDFFSKQNVFLKIITNLSKFSDDRFLKNHKDYFKKNKDWKMYGSINTLPLAETDPNILGLKNILINKIPISMIITAYKENLKEISRLITYLSKLFVFFKTPLRLELRLMYIKEVCSQVLDQAPNDFHQLTESFKECLKVSNSLDIPVILWNFPVCYARGVYNNLDENVEKRKKIKIVKIDKDNQLEDYKTRDFRDFFFKNGECEFCEYFDNCSGINRKYINDINFPELKRITH